VDNLDLPLNDHGRYLFAATEGTSRRLPGKGPGGTVRVLRWLILVGLLLPVLLFAAAGWWNRSALLEDVEGDGVRLVALFREQAGNLLAGHEIILDMVVDRVRGRDLDTIQSSTDLLRELEVMDRRLDGESEILLVDATGAVRATTVDVRPDRPPPAVERNCFVALSKNGVESCISQPRTDPESGHFLFSLSRRLEKNGTFNGIVQVAISADYIVGLWSSATPNTSDIVTMFTSDGIVLAQSGPQSGSGPGLPDAGKSVIGKMGQKDAGIITGPLTKGGADRITVYSKVAERPVYISLSLDKSAVLTAWHANLIVYGLVAGSAIAGILAALGIALRRARRERHAVNLLQAEIRERQRTQDQLRQSQKMESLGNLTGGMAHDFNNGLGVIIGCLELLDMLVETNQAAKDLCDEARDAALRCADLVRRLLAFARRQPLRPRQIDVNALVENMARLLSRTLGEDVTLTTRPGTELWPVMADPAQLESALTNLANNARDAMPKGGRLEITTKRTELDAHYVALYPEATAGEYVLIEVSDSGTGIPPTIIDRIFEPFFTTKPPGQGTGLGLSMVFGFVRQSGGHLTVYSEPGRGSTFRVYLPRTRVGDTRTAAPIDQRLVVGGDEAVLLVEDNGPLRRSTARQLARLGYQVREAEHAEAALTILSSGDRVDLLFTDVVMPGTMDGLDLAYHATRVRRGLKVLVTSGFPDVRGADQRMASCPFPLLNKPYLHDELARTVRVVLDGDEGQSPGTAMRTTGTVSV
jgi:signal transduction histidine kinase/ActR/RegA family two-component response regulator